MVRGRYSNMSYFITAMQLLCNTYSSVIREHYQAAPCTLKHIQCLILHKKLLSTEAVCRARRINWKWKPSYCFCGHVNMCNIVDENTSTVLSTLIGTHSCQFHANFNFNIKAFFILQHCCILYRNGDIQCKIKLFSVCEAFKREL